MDGENREFSTESSAEAPRVESSLLSHTVHQLMELRRRVKREGEAGGREYSYLSGVRDDGLPRWTDADGHAGREGEEYRLACFLLPSLSSIKEATTTKEEEMEGEDD